MNRNKKNREKKTKVEKFLFISSYTHACVRHTSVIGKVLKVV